MRSNTEGVGKVAIKNVLDQDVNPATEETLESLGNAIDPPSTIADGRKTVSSAGTAEALGASTTIRRLIVSALLTNEDVVVIGGSTVVAAAGTRRGIALLPGQSFDMSIDDINKVYVDSINSDEGVSFVYLV